MAKPPMKMDTKSVLARAERIQREEAGESMIMKKKPAPPVIRTTVSYRPTPMKKGK